MGQEVRSPSSRKRMPRACVVPPPLVLKSATDDHAIRLRRNSYTPVHFASRARSTSRIARRRGTAFRHSRRILLVFDSPTIASKQARISPFSRRTQDPCSRRNTVPLQVRTCSHALRRVPWPLAGCAGSSGRTRAPPVPPDFERGIRVVVRQIGEDDMQSVPVHTEDRSVPPPERHPTPFQPDDFRGRA